MQKPALSSKIPSLPRGLRTRFAPSPTGYLHLGHVASAIYVWGIGRRYGAEIILRIEDHDQGRVRNDFEASILSDLEWLGFKADLGVTHATETSAFRQSDHRERYESALAQLSASVYHCQCSRKDIQSRTGETADELRYDGYCRDKNVGPNLRLMLSGQTQSFCDLLLGDQIQSPIEQCGDLLLRDRNGCFTYNFAVTVDDIAEDIGLIIRGQDILPATGRQLELRQLFKATRQPFYLHHPLIWADDSKKLSKRDRSTSVGQWRDQGLTAAAIIGRAAFQVGLIQVDQPIEAKDVEGLFHA